MSDVGYVELQVTTNFTFLQGAAHPEELAAQAAVLGHDAVAVTDHNTLAGVVRGHLGAKTAGIRVIVGTRLNFADGTPSLLCLPTDLRGLWPLVAPSHFGQTPGRKGAMSPERNRSVFTGRGFRAWCRTSPDRHCTGKPRRGFFQLFESDARRT